MTNLNAYEIAQGFIDATPEGALNLFNALGSLMSHAKFPEIIVESVTDDGETYLGARCPHCKMLFAEDTLIAVDWGTRWSYSGEVNADEKYHLMDYGDAIEAGALHYQCGNCDRPITLPQGWTEN